MSNIIAQISREAKRIRKRHPSIKWQSAIKEASRKLKGKKRSPAKRKTTRRKVSGVKSIRRRAVVRKIKRAHRHEGKLISKLGSVTVAQSVSQTKEIIRERIGWMEASKLSAKTAKSKRGIQKRINELKKIYRQLN